MGDSLLMTLDGIALAGPWTGRRLRRESSEVAISALARQLRQFSDEADGHGSLHRKPPAALHTPQYFEALDGGPCYPLPRLHWVALAGAPDRGKQLSAADGLAKGRRPRAALGAEPAAD